MFEKCKKADIYENKGGAMICQALVNVNQTGQILLIIPRSAAYKPNSIYRVLFYDPVLGRVTCRCRLSSSVPLPKCQLNSLRCEVLEQMAQDQRRQDVKVPLGENILLHVVYQPGDVGKIPEGGSPATIENISAGGVYLKTPLQLEKGRRVWFEYRIDGETLTLSCVILRAESGKTNNGRVIYGYGCKFLDLLSKHENMLRSYIFQLQRKQRAAQQNEA